MSIEARRSRLEALVDLRSGVGLEIGALDSPVVTSPPWDVRYVDVLDTESLREHFRGDPNVSSDRIVEVDFPLQADGTMRTLAEAAAPGAPFAWAVASHVVEHVPDLIGWLEDVASLLSDDGRLFLVVPDRRFTFDALRPATTVGQVLEAHTNRATIPSERAVFDHYRSLVDVSSTQLWAGTRPSATHRRYTVLDATAMREKALAGEYVDSHVWTFSPAEFIAQLSELGGLDLLPFTVERVLRTMPGEIEFNVVLRRLPRSADAVERTALRRAALDALHVEEHFASLDDGGVADELDTPVAHGLPIADVMRDRAMEASGSGGEPSAVVMEVSPREERMLLALRSARRRMRAVRDRSRPGVS